MTVAIKSKIKKKLNNKDELASRPSASHRDRQKKHFVNQCMEIR